MNFLYPRTVSISRPTQQTGAGAVGYGGQLPSTDVQVASDIPASIQQKKEGRDPAAKLPGDARASLWRIFLKAKLAQGFVRDRDIIVDDVGVRYQVTAAYWAPLGYNCLCQLLES